MNSAIIKRSVVVAGKKTSVSLEDTFWLALKEIAAQSRTPLGQLLDKIAGERDNANLSSAVRRPPICDATLLQQIGPAGRPLQYSSRLLPAKRRRGVRARPGAKSPLAPGLFFDAVCIYFRA